MLGGSRDLISTQSVPNDPNVFEGNAGGAETEAELGEFFLLTPRLFVFFAD